MCVHTCMCAALSLTRPAACTYNSPFHILYPQPDNILLTAGFGDLKIGGFGNARYVQTGNQLTDLTNCGVEFLAPEAVTLQPLTTGADIWSAGVVACFM